MQPSLLLVFLLLASVVWCRGHHVEFDLRVPDYDVTDPDAYVCVAAQLPPKPHKLVGVIPRAKQEVVHHILLFGCVEPQQKPIGNNTVAWRCDHQPVCAGASNTILYGWGRNAPELVLPDGVGFSVGQGSGVRYIVAQVHYLDPKPRDDHSGVTLMLRPHATPYAAGLIAFAKMFEIPPHERSYPVKNQCCYKGHQPLTTFGVRVHTHTLGKTVFMEREKWDHSGMERVVERSPQLPQAFVPVDPHVIWPGDTLRMECDFDSRSRDTITYAGPTHNHEMCNMYMMVYAAHPYVVMCDGSVINSREERLGALPRGSVLQHDPAPFWKPPQPSAAGPPSTPPAQPGADVGDATSVAVAGDGTVWVLYRGSRSWTETTFDAENKITHADPVPEALVVQLQPETGAVLKRWGSGVFWLPHSITLDREGNVWVTDVGRHQVLKFSPDGQLLLEVGSKLTPGAGPNHFCKPTGVAVLRDLSFVVSDGYCNARVVRFGKDGKYVGEGTGPLAVAHSVLVDECDSRVYVASREDGRIVTFDLASLQQRGLQELRQYGKVWALHMGPYGDVLVMTYQEGQPGRIVNLFAPDDVWQLPGTEQLSPHDFALGAAAVGLSGASDRMYAVYVAPVGYTCPKGCGPLLKYVMVPSGLKMPDLGSLQPFNFTRAATSQHNVTSAAGAAKSHTNAPAAVTPGSAGKATTGGPTVGDDGSGQSHVVQGTQHVAGRAEAVEADEDAGSEPPAGEAAGDAGGEDAGEEGVQAPVPAETRATASETHKHVPAETQVPPAKIAAIIIAASLVAALVVYVAVVALRKYTSGLGTVLARSRTSGGGSSRVRAPSELNTLESIIANAEAEVEAGMYIKKQHRTVGSKPGLAGAMPQEATALLPGLGPIAKH